MKIERIAVLGGSGQVGRSLCNLLARAGYSLKVLTRRREGRRHELILLPQLDLVEADVHDRDVLTAQLAGCDAVINLVGTLNERGTRGEGFHHVYVQLAEKLLYACEQNGICRLLQASSLLADAKHGNSHYLRNIGRAEDLLHDNPHGIAVTSFQPSVIFGPHDQFLNRFATLLRISPVLPLPCPKARFAPVYVLDVARMMVRALNDSASHGKRFRLCGDRTYTLLQLVEYTCQQLGPLLLPRLILPLPGSPSRLQGRVCDLLSPLFHTFGMEKPYSMDNYHSTSRDFVCEQNDLAVYHITPTALEGIVPTYLAGHSARGRLARFRRRTHGI